MTYKEHMFSFMFSEILFSFYYVKMYITFQPYALREVPLWQILCNVICELVRSKEPLFHFYGQITHPDVYMHAEFFVSQKVGVNILIFHNIRTPFTEIQYRPHYCRESFHYCSICICFLILTTTLQSRLAGMYRNVINSWHPHLHTTVLPSFDNKNQLIVEGHIAQA